MFFNFYLKAAAAVVLEIPSSARYPLDYISETLPQSSAIKITNFPVQTLFGQSLLHTGSFEWDTRDNIELFKNVLMQCKYKGPIEWSIEELTFIELRKLHTPKIVDDIMKRYIDKNITWSDDSEVYTLEGVHIDLYKTIQELISKLI